MDEGEMVWWIKWMDGWVVVDFNLASVVVSMYCIDAGVKSCE